MRLLEGVASVADVGEFVATVGDISEETETTVQAFDARYVVSEAHLRRAVELADRSFERGENVARDRAVEILLYAAGRRQIDDALAMGVSPGETPVVVLVEGSEAGEDAAAAAVAERLDFEPAETLGDYDESLVREFFDVGDAELATVDGDLESLVLERVALLVVEK
ncbi:KEOPS complex subunit Cgi121 [Halopelagius longus]|uniref:KEOPS complex component n=1 Tax=Halopelagius longus TaxID=1236180 RepID=A0A1H1EQ33_9EURY|nr:KEOPS complex subunit Cgi121 [Halopelagius longus]RDI71841.1 KEOPS complex component [Halopelagius longus]SDQ90720.1 KEOPS complex subunit Cgi121 [Halopelagius longus]